MTKISLVLTGGRRLTSCRCIVDVAAPGDDFAVSAVSAANAEVAKDQKAELAFRAKQKADHDRRVAQDNALESFEVPKIV